MIKNFLKTNLIVFFFFNLANFLQLLFQILIIRNLTGYDFINYSSLNSLIALLALPAGAFTIGISSYLAEKNKNIKSFLGTLNALIIIFFILIFFYWIFIDDIGNYIRINNKKILYLAITICFISYINALFLAYYNANKKYLRLCVFNLIPFIFKLIFLFYFFYINKDYNYEIVFYCIFFSSFISFLIYLLDLLKDLKTKKLKFNYINFASLEKFFFILISLIITHFFINYDIVLLSNKINDLNFSSQFSAINIVKITFYIISMLPLLITSEYSKNKIIKKSKLYYILLLSTLIQIFTIICLYLLSEFFLIVVFNFKDIEIFKKMLIIYTPILLFVNIISLINTFFISIKSYYPIIIQAIIVSILYYYSRSLEQGNSDLIFNFFIVSSIIILTINFFLFIKNR
jgi:hypothetical protein